MAYENPTYTNPDQWYTQDGGGDYSGSDPNAMEFYDWLQQYLSNYGKTTVQPYPWLPPEEVGGMRYDANNPWTPQHTQALTDYDNSTIRSEFTGPIPSGVVGGGSVIYGRQDPGKDIVWGEQFNPGPPRNWERNPAPHLGEILMPLDPDSQKVYDYLNSPEAQNPIDNSYQYQNLYNPVVHEGMSPEAQNPLRNTNALYAPSSSVPSYGEGQEGFTKPWDLQEATGERPGPPIPGPSLTPEGTRYFADKGPTIPSSVFSVSSVNYPSAFDKQDSGSGLQEDLMKQLLQNRQQTGTMKGASIL